MKATRRRANSTHGVLAPGLGEEAQRLDGEVVVLLVEAVAARLGEREDLRRATAAARAVDLLLARLDDALLEQVVEVAAYGGRASGRGARRASAAVDGPFSRIERATRSRVGASPSGLAEARLGAPAVDPDNSTTTV